MSANNYTLVYKVNKRWYIWNDLMAEEGCPNDELTKQNSTISFKRLINAISWVNERGCGEYGYQVNNLCKPKDGFKEVIDLESFK